MRPRHKAAENFVIWLSVFTNGSSFNEAAA